MPRTKEFEAPIKVEDEDLFIKPEPQVKIKREKESVRPRLKPQRPSIQLNQSLRAHAQESSNPRPVKPEPKTPTPSQKHSRTEVSSGSDDLPRDPLASFRIYQHPSESPVRSLSDRTRMPSVTLSGLSPLVPVISNITTVPLSFDDDLQSHYDTVQIQASLESSSHRTAPEQVEIMQSLPEHLPGRTRQQQREWDRIMTPALGRKKSKGKQKN